MHCVEVMPPKMQPIHCSWKTIIISMEPGEPTRSWSTMKFSQASKESLDLHSEHHPCQRDGRSEAQAEDWPTPATGSLYQWRAEDDVSHTHRHMMSDSPHTLSTYTQTHFVTIFHHHFQVLKTHYNINLACCLVDMSWLYSVLTKW